MILLPVQLRNKCLYYQVGIISYSNGLMAHSIEQRTKGRWTILSRCQEFIDTIVTTASHLSTGRKGYHYIWRCKATSEQQALSLHSSFNRSFTTQPPYSLSKSTGNSPQFLQVIPQSSTHWRHWSGYPRRTGGRCQFSTTSRTQPKRYEIHKRCARDTFINHSQHIRQ